MASAKDEERLTRLRAELEAIGKWEECHRQENTSDPQHEVAHQARQLRLREIMREIQLLSNDARKAS